MGQRIAAFPRAICVQKIAKGQVAAAGDVAGSHVRPRFGFFAGKSSCATGIHDIGFLAVQIGEHVCFVTHGLFVFPDGEVAVAQRRLAGFERASFGFPFCNAAIEDGDIMRAKQGQHPPSARCRFERAVVVDHDTAAVAQAQRLHAAGKFFWRRQCIGQAAVCVGEFLQVHENSAGNMATFIFGLRIAASIGHEPGGIDHAQIRCTDFVRQPFGTY